MIAPASSTCAWLIAKERVDAKDREAFDAADLQLTTLLCRLAEAPQDEALFAVLLALASACREGSLCVFLEPTALIEALQALFTAAGAKPPNAGREPKALTQGFLAAMDAGRYETILGSEADAKPLIRRNGWLYFHRTFRAEKILAQGLLRLRRAEPFVCDPKTARAVFRHILEENPLRAQGPGSSPLQLTSAQQWALAAATRERIFVLSGGPGTGKTALTATLLRALVRLRRLDPSRIRLCAPTGRAAQRLQESLRHGLGSLAPSSHPEKDPDHDLLNLPVETLHRLLGYHPPSGRFARHAGDPLEADLVLVDEASMADVFTLAALVEALPPPAALILVGDADQLPSVAAGSTLGELLPEKRRSNLDAKTRAWIAACFPGGRQPDSQPLAEATLPAVVLDRSHRSRQAILDLAAAVNAGDIASVLQDFGSATRITKHNFANPFSSDPEATALSRFEVADADPAAQLTTLLEGYADALFFDRRNGGRNYAEWLQTRHADAEEAPLLIGALFDFLASSRILTGARHGALGCERINQLLRRRLEARFEGEEPYGHPAGFHGAPLLITRNDARTGLFNGEVGVWLRGTSGLSAYFPRPESREKYLRLPAAFLPPQEPAFATTVHKSQGSEYDEVLIVLPEPGNRLLTREILYTAVTRARKTVRLHASEAALREAVARRMRRAGGLRSYFLS